MNAGKGECLKEIRQKLSNHRAASRSEAAGVVLSTALSMLLSAAFLLFVSAACPDFASADEGNPAPGVHTPKHPAHVVHVKHKKNGPYVVVDQGSSTGFVIGRDVCFYDENQVKQACASIVRTKQRAAAVVVGKADFAKMSIGLLAWPEDLGPLPASAPVAEEKKAAEVAEEKKATSDAADLQTQEDDPPEPILPPLLSSRAQWHVSPTFALPIWMNDLRFNSSARITGTGKIWESGDTIKGSAVGFGIRYYMPQNGRGDSAIDFTYQFIPQRPVKDDFDTTDGGTLVQSGVLSHQYRFRWFRGATWRHDDTSDLLLYTGLGYDFIKTKFNASKVGGSSAELVSGVITGHGFEIPLVVEWQQFIGGWMLTTGLDMGLPIGVFGVKSTGTVSYDEDVSSADKSFKGAVQAVNVRRGWFTLAMQVGIGAKF
jgi:hypothetical protein